MAFKLHLFQKIVIFFIVAQFLALFVGYYFNFYMAANQELVQMPYQPNEANGIFLLVGYILVGTAGLLLLIKFYRGEFLFRALEFFMIFSAATLFFISVIVALNTITLNLSLYDFGDPILLLGALLGFIVAMGKFLLPAIRNYTAILASASVGALFGLTLGLFPAILFAGVMCFYDFFAVFVSKHMIALAKGISRQQLSFSIAASEKLAGKEKEEFRKKVSHLSPGDRKYVLQSGGDIKKMELGTGDITIPAMVSVASLLEFGPGAGLAVLLGSTIGIYFLLWKGSRKNLFLPALPPIVSGGLIMLAIYLLVFTNRLAIPF
ncbi:hypothetical protein COT30_04810 [Candidatus Micrarchaeota archaeon CG08_land_8_20_14_0_20_49_17]|nr:MAG: hypothetical protein AUJ13_00115 [Candidatus Micrarchaeota archaeon CG1_02_49_24]PIU09348.1 MAG: hypothetical protein COT30_04810 [Candidatus Micrarchaeota archaeon CG08_land_8_20_14_0_20_49_17]PIZ99084.1 MAG: hypothetical protein COX84_01370 [Candidatus Micrarchaeota archaeon CG_4_10_14_0_2_um_filter_49_7]HII53503.1 hypothetical protein [Candidatus Micrarchaeota archaeon]